MPTTKQTATGTDAPTERHLWSRMTASTHLMLPLHRYVKQLVKLATSPLSSAFKSFRSATAGCGTQTGQPSLQQVRYLQPWHCAKASTLASCVRYPHWALFGLEDKAILFTPIRLSLLSCKWVPTLLGRYLRRTSILSRRVSTTAL